MPLFYFLILAHLIADFIQPAKLVGWYKKSTYGLLVHVSIYSVLNLIVIIGYSNWWVWLFILSLSHFLIDHFKYLLDTRISIRGFFILILDQALHILVIYLVVFAADLASKDPGLFMKNMETYYLYLPTVIAYISGTFAVSILIFEADRTFVQGSSYSESGQVINLRDRLLGIIERTIALSVIIYKFYILIPFCFTYSMVSLFRSHNGKKKHKDILELSISFSSILVIGFILTYFI